MINSAHLCVHGSLSRTGAIRYRTRRALYSGQTQSVCQLISQSDCNVLHVLFCFQFKTLNFTGVELMGLFRSVQPQLGSRSGIRLRKKDVTQPHSFTLSVIPGHVDTNHSSHHNKPGILAQTEVKRCYMWEDVLRVPVRHGRIRGTLFIPQSMCIIKIVHVSFTVHKMESP